MAKFVGYDSLGIALFAVLIACRIIPLFFAYDPWLDEAMVIANLPLISLSDMFQPLPLFEQAEPLGYLVSIKAIYSLVEDPVFRVVALRIFTGIASSVAAVLLYLMARNIQDSRLAVLSLVFFGLTPVAAKYGLEIKRYTFEMLAMCLMLFYAQRLILMPGKRSLTLLTVSGLFTILFTFSAPLIILPVFAGILAASGAHSPKRLIDAQMRRIIYHGLFLLAVFAVFYLSYTLRVTQVQFDAYAHVYQTAMLDFSSPRLWLKFPRLLADMTWIYGAWYIWMLLFAVLMPAGLWYLYRNSPLFCAAFAAAVLFILLLSLLGLYPILYYRHFLFLLPLASLGLGGGLLQLGSVIRRFLPERLAPIAGAAVIGMVVTFGSGFSLDRVGNVRLAQNVSPVIDYLIAHNRNNAPVWVYYGAQPVMRVLAPDQIRQIGLVSHISQVPGWIWRQRKALTSITSDAYFAAMRSDLHGLGEAYLVFTHFWPERVHSNGLGRFRKIAEDEIGNCRTIDLEGSAVLWHCGAGR